jgi:hypothetical protein
VTETADRPRLGAQGQVYVTLAAAQSYADAERLGIEEARRELTEYLLEATPSGDGTAGHPERWRFRRRSTGLDITARISREGKLLVVVAANVRDHNAGSRRR